MTCQSFNCGCGLYCLRSHPQVPCPFFYSYSSLFHYWVSFYVSVISGFVSPYFSLLSVLFYFPSVFFSLTCIIYLAVLTGCPNWPSTLEGSDPFAAEFVHHDHHLQGTTNNWSLKSALLSNLFLPVGLLSRLGHCVRTVHLKV